MSEERLFVDVIRELHNAKKTGALYVSIVETSEDLVRITSGTGYLPHPLRIGRWQ